MKELSAEYEKGRIAVDAVIFTIVNGTLMVYLHKREVEPFMGKYELLGGLLKKNERAEDTLMRKLKETIGDYRIYFEQFHTFTEPDRDPRGRTVSVGFIALVNSENIDSMDNWHDINGLKKLAFDHSVIIQKAREHLRENVEHLVVKQFMPKYFPLNDLQIVYEIISDKKYDNRNFRKQMLGMGIVKETDKIQKKVAHRPAKLYMFTS
jgi:8-oxo-dGTP diphosphatase